MNATIKTSLADFNPSSVWFASIGIPTGIEVKFTGIEDEETGETYDLDPADIESALPFDWNLDGTVGEDGDWEWDGEGSPTDWNRNTVTRITASRPE